MNCRPSFPFFLVEAKKEAAGESTQTCCSQEGDKSTKQTDQEGRQEWLQSKKKSAESEMILSRSSLHTKLSTWTFYTVHRAWLFTEWSIYSACFFLCVDYKRYLKWSVVMFLFSKCFVTKMLFHIFTTSVKSTGVSELAYTQWQGPEMSKAKCCSSLINIIDYTYGFHAYVKMSV